MSAEQLPPVLPEDECGVDRQAPQEVRVQPEGAEGKRPPSQATQLVELAELRYDFFTATSGEPFAVPKPGHGPYVARMLRGGRDSLRAELANAYVGNHGRVPSSQATADALLVLEGRARCGARVNLALRVARNGPDLVLDLGDDTGRVVVVKPDSWSIVDRSPVLFRRSDLTGTLPEPIRGGSLGELRNLLNITDGSWPLLIGCQVANLMGHIPHPILALQGEHGCGKSTVLRITASVIDPSPAQLRTSPRDVEQWAVAASGSWIVALDNVSVIQPWLSDALCRAVTGDGMVRRRLYSDDGLSVLAFRRVVMLSSIDPGALRGDLADRLLPIDLERIPAERRRLDDELAERWNEVHPRVLGALLDLTAAVLRELPKVKLASLPRMADFARVLAAIDRVLGTEALKTYLGLGQRLAADVIDSDPVAIAVREHVIQCQSWEGSAGELLKLLTPVDKPAPRGWPTTPQGMGAALKRAAPDLRAVGIDVEQKPREADRRTWTLTKQASEETGEDPGAGRRARSEDSPENLSHMSQRHKSALTSGNAVTFPVTFEDLGTRTSHPNVTPSQPADLRKHLCSADCDDRDDQNGLPSTDPTTATTATPATSPLVVAFAPPPEPCEVCRQPCTVTSDGRRAHPSCARFA